MIYVLVLIIVVVVGGAVVIFVVVGGSCRGVMVLHAFLLFYPFYS